MDASDERRWKVGELARATGLTVRALHHYDEVGLLVPSERTSAGHRLYDDDDVRRLYRILALRRLGLRLDEIGALLDRDGVSLRETVRRHLEQVERDLELKRGLRDRLRQLLDALERSIEPPVEEFLNAIGEMSVMGASIEDVLIRVRDEELAEPPPRLAREDSRVVLLREEGGGRVLPIWIGSQEGDELVLQRTGRKLPRPLAPDLTARLLDVGGVRVEHVVIESLRDNTFYATISVNAAGESTEVDARPSDALNLAARVGAPVLVASEVMEASGVEADVELDNPLSALDRLGQSEETRGKWRSLTADLLWSLYPASSGGPLLERFTERARQALALAQDEARRLKHPHIRPDHLLLGLLGERDGIAADALGSLELNPEAVRARASQALAPTDAPPAKHMSFSPNGKRVLELALSEALARGPSDIDTEHILLALLRVDDGLLGDFDIPVRRAREEVHAAISRAPGREATPRKDQRGSRP